MRRRLKVDKFLIFCDVISFLIYKLRKECCLMQTKHWRESCEYYSETQLRASWPGGEESSSHTTSTSSNVSHMIFFQPLDCNSILQIGYIAVGSDQINASNGQNVNRLIPGWML